MLPTGLPLVLGLAGCFLAALTVLPGVVLKLIALVRRWRGQRVELPAVFGPLFWYELVRVTRRGAQFRLRTLYSLFLLVSLLIAYLSEFREVNPIRLIFGPGEEFPRERVTAFAEAFFHTFLFCQLIALTIVTPVFAGGSITEEKDRGTLTFLQTSLLSSREIVMGKLAARVVFVLGLALTGLPVLAITLLFGGVDPDTLVTSFVAAVMSTVSLAAFSFWQATRHDTLKSVLYSAYSWVWGLGVFAACCGAMTDGYGMGLSPFNLLILSIHEAGRMRFDIITVVVIHIIAHGVIALFLGLLAMGNVRAMLLKQPKPGTARWVEATPPPPEPETQERERTPLRHIHIPYIREEDPLLWKETYFGGRLPSFETDMAKGCSLALVVAISLPLMFGAFVAAATSKEPQVELNIFFRVLSIGLVAFLIPLAGVRAVGCVSRERQQQTLDSLFTLPVDRRDFLRAKWRAAFNWLFPWLVAYAVLSLVFFFTWSVHPLGFLLALVIIASAVPFFLTLAVWLSVKCVTVVQATTWYLGIVFASFLLPPMAAVLVRGAADLLGLPVQEYDLSTSAMSLPFAINTLAVRWPKWHALPSELLGATLAAALVCGLFWLLAAKLWANAVRRFENEGR